MSRGQRKPCNNPDCPNTIPLVKKIGNSTGYQDYCSIKCFHDFSPRKIAVVKKWYPDVHSTAMSSKFEEIVQYINKQFGSDSERAKALGISRSAYRQWRKNVEK